MREPAGSTATRSSARRGRRAASTLCAVGATALFALPAVASAYPRHGIVTVSRFGKLRSGMTIPTVTAAWGKPRATHSRKGDLATELVYGRGVRSIDVIFYNAGKGPRLDQVSTRLPGYRLAGVGPGSSWAALRAALPTATCAWNNVDDFAQGCLYVTKDFGRNPHQHRVYFSGPKGGPIRMLNLVTNHAG